MWWSRLLSGYNLTWNIFLIQAAVLSLCTCVNSILSLKLPEVHWNSSNPMFKTSNNDHIIEVNVNDHLDFVCPYYPEGAEVDTHEYYLIHRVTRREYEDCNIDPSNSPLVIVNCNAPHERRFFTLSFQEFLPTPNVPEFQRGGTYYFITTSRGDSSGLQNKFRGACYHSNMKLTIKVCCGTSEECAVPEGRGCCPCPPDNSTTSATTPTTTLTTTTTTTQTPQQTTPKSTPRPATVVPPTHQQGSSTPSPSPKFSHSTTASKSPPDKGATDSNSVVDPTSPTDKPHNENYVSSAYRQTHSISLHLTGLLSAYTLKAFLGR